MEKTQSEVTDKIRFAIKEKLKIMNTFVDDELPDYIMILIANKRSKHQMEKDLSLFLGSKTKDFTNWLWDLVNSFKAGAKSKTSKIGAALDHHFDNIENKAEEEDVLNYDPAEEGESLCLEESCESPAGHEKVVQSHAPNPQTSLTPEFPVNIPKDSPMTTTADFPQLKIDIKQEKIDPDIVVAEPVKIKSNEKTIQKSAKVYPMRRISHSNLPNKESVTKPSNFLRSEYGGVSSVVTMSQRKYGGPAALQANKLLLKAVNDATKSVLKGKATNECYKPTPIKELISSKNNVDVVDDKVATQNNHVDFVVNPVILMNEEVSEQNVSSCDGLNPNNSRRIVNLSCDASENHYNFEESNNLLNVEKFDFHTEEANTASPHFIVTLDGVNFPSLKRKHGSIEEPMDIDDDNNYSDEEIEESRDKKPKLAERCKYWPACKNNVNCAYHHPTIPCKSFPNCKFGDKCLYIHPNCKFDALCSKRDCPFTHCSMRKYPSLPAAVIHSAKIPKAKTVCKYYPRCTAKSCPFIHPKLCKFGTQCRAPKCLFGHFKIPQRDQLKWTSK